MQKMLNQMKTSSFWQLGERVDKLITIEYLPIKARLHILCGTYAASTLFCIGLLSRLLAPDLPTFGIIFYFTAILTVSSLIGFFIIAYNIYVESYVNPHVLSIVTIFLFLIVYTISIMYVGVVGGLLMFALVIVILMLNLMGTLWGYFILLCLFIVTLLVGYSWQFGSPTLDYLAISDPTNFDTWFRGSVAWFIMAGLMAYTHIVVHGELSKSLKIQAHVIDKLRDEKLKNAEIVSEQETIREQLDIRHRLDLSQRIAGLLAHDLSNSMTPILGNVDLLLENNQRNGADIQTFHSLKEIRVAALDIREMLSELQDFNRKSNAPLTSMNLLEEIHRTLADLQQMMPTEITIDVKGVPDLALADDRDAIEIYGSPELFRQLLEILILASRKSLDQRGVIEVDVQKVRLSSDLVKRWGLQEYYFDSRWIELNIRLEGEVVDDAASLLFASSRADVSINKGLLGSSAIETKPHAFSMGDSLLKIFKAEVDHRAAISGEKSISIYFPSSQALTIG